MNRFTSYRRYEFFGEELPKGHDMGILEKTVKLK